IALRDALLKDKRLR
ncbi:unnamed protein product, partial [Rotaria magnacalcarata]